MTILSPLPSTTRTASTLTSSHAFRGFYGRLLVESDAEVVRYIPPDLCTSTHLRLRFNFHLTLACLHFTAGKYETNHLVRDT